jgi:4-amino-4-deoxychorismate lyase
MKVGYNGTVVEAGEAVISVHDHGFLYGLGLFETMRTYGGEPFLLERHYARLMDGCRELGIEWRMELGELRAWIRACMAANGLDEAYVRLTVSAGEGELGLQTAPYEQPNAIVLVKPLPRMDEQLYRAGRELRLLETPRNTPETRVRMKSLHYMNNVIAKRELTASGGAAGAEGLMLTREGRLAEGIVSNVFFAKDGVICTPSLDTGILAGITRAVVLELARSLGMLTEEGLYTWDDLLDADEAWLTNSVQELVPVTRLDSGAGGNAGISVLSGGMIGQSTAALLAAYRAMTRQ